MDEKHMADIQHIRNMMEQSSRFLSLSGLSGISSGIIALVAATIAGLLLGGTAIPLPESASYPMSGKLAALALVTLLLAVGSAAYFTIKKNRRVTQPLWNRLSKRLLLQLAIPLAAGAVFCLACVVREQTDWVVAGMLVFYGLALVNAAKYTLGDIQYLGYGEIGLGLLAFFVPEYGIVLWAAGFGILHIVYGLIMYRKYE